MRYVVLGAGRQGLAIAYDLGRWGEAGALTLVDADRDRLRRGAERLRTLLPDVRVKTVTRRLNGADGAAVVRGHDAAVSAMPYRFNPALASAAVRSGVSFCDLGGHTDLVEEELKLHAKARKAGVSIVPDCGIAPGLANVLAAIAVEEVADATDVRIYCGGLPVPPRGSLKYSLTFDIAGLTNEYTGHATVLRDGKLKKVETFTEMEPIDGPRELGRLEAFHTAGGASTAPKTFRGTLRTYEYKTLRYPGHFAQFRAMIDLGLLDRTPVEVAGSRVVPRELFHVVAGPRLRDPAVRDALYLRVDCTDRRGRGVRYRLFVRYDEATGFTAMEQATGYPTALVAHALARRAILPGATTPERAGFGPEHITALRRRGLRIRRTTIG